MQAYARRNKACYSGIYEQVAEGKAEKLHEILSAHRRDLAHILPECERMNQSLYSNAIDYYQISNIEFNHGEHRWK